MALPDGSSLPLRFPLPSMVFMPVNMETASSEEKERRLIRRRDSMKTAVVVEDTARVGFSHSEYAKLLAEKMREQESAQLASTAVAESAREPAAPAALSAPGPTSMEESDPQNDEVKIKPVHPPPAPQRAPPRALIRTPIVSQPLPPPPVSTPRVPGPPSTEMHLERINTRGRGSASPTAGRHPMQATKRPFLSTRPSPPAARVFTPLAKGPVFREVLSAPSTPLLKQGQFQTRDKPILKEQPRMMPIKFTLGQRRATRASSAPPLAGPKAMKP